MRPNASRRMKKGEFEQCQKNGVKDIVEISVGYDGLTLAQSKQGTPLNLTLAQVFLALAKQVPGPDGKLIANPYKTWSDIDKSLPDVRSKFSGRRRPPAPATRCTELFMEGGRGTDPGDGSHQEGRSEGV